MSCSIIIKNVDLKCERRVCVDSEEELKNMTVEEFRRRFCPDDPWHRYTFYYVHEELEDDQTRGDCGIKHESTVHEFERGGGDRFRIISSHKRLKDHQTLGYYGIGEGSTILEYEEEQLVDSAGPSSPEDKVKGVPRTESMEILADMQQPQLESSEQCCLL